MGKVSEDSVNNALNAGLAVMDWQDAPDVVRNRLRRFARAVLQSHCEAIEAALNGVEMPAGMAQTIADAKPAPDYVPPIAIGGNGWYKGLLGEFAGMGMAPASVLGEAMKLPPSEMHVDLAQGASETLGVVLKLKDGKLVVDRKMTDEEMQRFNGLRAGLYTDDGKKQPTPVFDAVKRAIDAEYPVTETTVTGNTEAQDLHKEALDAGIQRFIAAIEAASAPSKCCICGARPLVRIDTPLCRQCSDLWDIAGAKGPEAMPQPIEGCPCGCDERVAAANLLGERAKASQVNAERYPINNNRLNPDARLRLTCGCGKDYWKLHATDRFEMNDHAYCAECLHDARARLQKAAAERAAIEKNNAVLQSMKREVRFRLCPRHMGRCDCDRPIANYPSDHIVKDNLNVAVDGCEKK